MKRSEIVTRINKLQESKARLEKDLRNLIERESLAKDSMAASLMTGDPLPPELAQVRVDKQTTIEALEFCTAEIERQRAALIALERAEEASAWPAIDSGLMEHLKEIQRLLGDSGLQGELNLTRNLLSSAQRISGIHSQDASIKTHRFVSFADQLGIALTQLIKEAELLEKMR